MNTNYDINYDMGALDRLKDAAIGALSVLDDIATNDDASMGMDDIEDLCAARTLLAEALGYVYNEDTGRYEPQE